MIKRIIEKIKSALNRRKEQGNPTPHEQKQSLPEKPTEPLPEEPQGLVNKVRSSNLKFDVTPWIISKWIISIGIWVGTLFSLYLLYIFHDLPSIDKLEELSRDRKVTVLDNQNEVITTYGDIYGNYVYYYELPRNLKNAVIAIEDRKFFDHWGINIWSIVRAAIANLRAGYTVQGGSTITQQLSKVVFLSNKRTLKRKLQEVLLSLELEHKFTKQQILAIYLNRVYLGAGISGYRCSCKILFW